MFASFEEWLSATKAPLNKDRLAEIAEHSPSVQEVVAHRPTLQKK